MFSTGFIACYEGSSHGTRGKTVLGDVSELGAGVITSYKQSLYWSVLPVEDPNVGSLGKSSEFRTNMLAVGGLQLQTDWHVTLEGWLGGMA